MSAFDTQTTICNRALSDIGQRNLISDFNTDTSPTGIQCRLWYDNIRQSLLRAAPWGCARKTLALQLLGLQTDNPPGAPWPWLAKYEWPTDCLKMNYIVPPPLPPASGPAPPNVSTVTPQVPWPMPSRAHQFIRAYDDSGDTPVQVLLANVLNAFGVYVADVTVVPMFDAGLVTALQATLSAKFVMPMTGNAGMRTAFQQLAEAEIMKARAQTANESITRSDHTPDWIAGRGSSYPSAVGGLMIPGAMWFSGWDDISWSE